MDLMKDCVSTLSSTMDTWAADAVLELERDDSPYESVQSAFPRKVIFDHAVCRFAVQIVKDSQNAHVRDCSRQFSGTFFYLRCSSSYCVIIPEFEFKIAWA